MAFLCPSRLGRKQKKGLQSMFNKLPGNTKTDSITLEDLVKLSLKNPEARRIVLQSFTACADHELTVKQGQKVRYIYQEGDWAYIATNDKKEGFVPHTVIAKIGVPNKPTDKVIDTGTYTKKTFDIRKISVESEGTDVSVSDNADDSFVSSEWSNDSMLEINSLGIDQGNVSELPGTNSIKTSGSHHSNQEDVTPPSPLAQYKVITDYKGHDEKEVSVRADDIVHLLDTSDPNWFWVRTLEGAEGYMPSYYVEEIPNNKHNAKVHRNDSKNKNTRAVKGSNIDIEYEYDLNTVCNEDEYSVFSEDVSDKATASDMQPQQKVRPKKPPRKNKPKSGSISQNLNDSIDSLDSVLTDSTMGAINDSVFDCSFSAESFLQDDIDATDDDIGYIGTPRGRVPSGLPYRDLIGFHLNSEIKHRHPSTHNKSLSKRSERRSHRAHSVQTNGPDAILNKNISNKALVNKQSSKYSEYSHQNDESFLSRTSDRRRNRPVSVPAFTTFQESRNGYFDEYFYEDSDTQFTNSDEHDVINVGEILKKRMALESDKNERTSGKQGHDRTSGRRQHDTHLNAETQFHEKPKIKPFLLNLPTTNIEKQHSKCNNTGNKEKANVETNRKIEGTRSSNSSRRVNGNDVPINTQNKNKEEHNCKPLSVNKKQLSSTDLRLIGKNKTDESVTTKSSSNTPNFKSSDNKSSKKHPVLKQYNSTTDLRAISDLRTENVNDKTKYTGSSINGMNTLEKDDDSFNNTGHKHKGKRQYNSSSDLRSTDEPSKTEKKYHQHKHSHHGDMGHSATRRYNSSTDLRHTNESADWSFGYPRKSRNTSGEDQQVTCVKNSSDASKHDSKILNLNGSWGSSVSPQRHDYSDSEDDFDDEKMMRLLNETDDLLNVSDDLLCGDPYRESLDETANECNTKANKEANDKCNQFLTNSTIGINGMTSVPRNIETTSTNNESKKEVKVKSKSIEVQTDLNEDTCRNCSVCKKRSGPNNNIFSSDVRGITEFVAQCNYEPEADNMLPMKMGEIVHVGLDGQDSDKWYWAFSPRLRMYGFIPKEQVKIPMVTII